MVELYGSSVSGLRHTWVWPVSLVGPSLLVRVSAVRVQRYAYGAASSNPDSNMSTGTADTGEHTAQT